MTKRHKIKFKLHNLKTLTELKDGGELIESDYTIPIKLSDGEVAVAQFESSEREAPKDLLTNKVYHLKYINQQLKSVETEVQNNSYLENSSLGALLKKQLDLFFNNLWVYDDVGVSNKKRGMLLHSEPGSGKSVSIAKYSKEFSDEKGACVMIWPSDKIEADDLNHYLSNGVEWEKVDKLILVIEDIGGGDIQRGGQVNAVESSLLNFLDGIEVVYPHPTFVVATTNNPDAQLSTLTSRPGRFDMVVKVPNLSDLEKLTFYKFFGKKYFDLDEAAEHKLVDLSKKFMVAHIKEAVIRARLEMTINSDTFQNSLLLSAKEISDWIKKQETGSLGADKMQRSMAFSLDD